MGYSKTGFAGVTNLWLTFQDAFWDPVKVCGEYKHYYFRFKDALEGARYMLEEASKCGATQFEVRDHYGHADGYDIIQ